MNDEVNELINELKDIHTMLKEKDDIIFKLRNCFNCQYSYTTEICRKCKNLSMWSMRE